MTKSQIFNWDKLPVFKIIFGSYLTWHFIELLPYAEELFGKNGMIKNYELSPTNWFPNILNYVDAGVVVSILILISLLFIFNSGYLKQICAILLWYGWACLLNRNVFINNPGMAYVGWILIVFALGIENDKTVYWIAWFLMCLGYTVSGLHKLQCPSWIDGYALKYVLTSPIARNNIITNMILGVLENVDTFSLPSLQAVPDIVLKIMTWSSLILELSCLFFGLFKHTRKLYWFALLGLHIGIIMTINFTDLTLGVLMIHFFTFDTRWLN